MWRRGQLRLKAESGGNGKHASSDWKQARDADGTGTVGKRWPAMVVTPREDGALRRIVRLKEESVR